MTQGGHCPKPVLQLVQGEFLEAGKKRLVGDTTLQSNTGKAKDLRAEALALKELAADLSLENRLLKKT